MPVYVDNMSAPYGRMVMCHMVEGSMSDEEFVRANWISVGNVGTRRHPVPVINGVDVSLNCNSEWDSGWSAAAEFTRNRLSEIAEVEEEIDWLIIKGATSVGVPNRIIARLQAVLSKLREGMKETV